MTLEPIRGWDTLGFRGTCSLGYRLLAKGGDELILGDAYAEISSRTMLPVSHLFWAPCGSGWRPRRSAGATLRTAEARKKPGMTPPSALRLAELWYSCSGWSSCPGRGAAYEEACHEADDLDSIGFAIAMNSLKVSSSTLVVDIVNRALTICGMAGYREDSPYSLGRTCATPMGRRSW